MPLVNRILLAITIILVDLVVFVIPLTALFAAYVLIARPASFRDFMNRLYADG